MAAVSASDVWAVGSYGSGGTNRTLIEHWNGTAWTRAPSPNLSSSSNILFGIDATSASNIWAVGQYSNGTADQTLALHCC